MNKDSTYELLGIREQVTNSSAVRVRGSLRAKGSAAFVGVAIKAGYGEAKETTNQFARIKF